MEKKKRIGSANKDYEKAYEAIVKGGLSFPAASLQPGNFELFTMYKPGKQTYSTGLTL